MSTSVPQRSFRRGEVAPEFYGASDTPEYLQSLRTCKNFLPIAHGALKNRPGTLLDARAKAGTPVVRPFVFSDTQTMVLEFGAGYIRFHTKGGVVLNGGLPYEVVTPYLAADLPLLKFAQFGDVITITRVGYAPRDLSRLSNTNWTLGPSSFKPPVGFVVQTLAVAANGFGGDNGTGWNNATLYLAGMYAFDGAAGVPASYICLATNTNKQPSANAAYWALSVDATHTVREWDYVVTTKYKDSLGRSLEGLPCAHLAVNAVRSFDRPITIQWTAPANPGFNYVITGYGIYVGRNGLYGWLNDVGPTVTSYKDDGTTQDYTKQPPKGTDPFLVADGNNSAATHDYPAVGAFHELRRVYARPNLRPNHLIGSKQGDITNFDVNFPVQDTDSYDFGIASNKLEEIRSMLSLKRLLLFTSHTVFAAQGAPGSTIKPTNVQLLPEEGDQGANYIQPVAVGNIAIYVTAKGNHFRDVFFNWQVDGLDGTDLSLMAQHLLDGFTIVDMWYAAVPWSTVWAARSDGLLISLTYDRRTGTIAWAQHPMNGQVLSGCSVPEGTEDAVYLVVSRPTGVFIERMASRIVQDVRTSVFVDCGVQVDRRNTSINSMTVTGGVQWVAGELVTVTASAASFAGTDLGDQVVIAPDSTTVLNPDGTVNRIVRPVRITVTAFTDATHVTGRLEANLDIIYRNNATTAWGWARTNFTGLDHLNGQTVNALVDGAVQGPFAVAGGAVQFNPPGVIAAVGLQYVSDAELMDLSPSSVRTSVKNVERVVFEVVGSRGIWAGETFDKLVPAKVKSAADVTGAPALVTDQVPVPIKSSWNTGGRAVVRQLDPLPLTITAAIREVELGGKGT